MIASTNGWPSARLGDVLRLRKEVIHPRNNPTGLATFVGLEHIESGTGRRIGSLPVDMAQLTGRKPRFQKGDIVYGYLRPYLNKVWLADFDGLCSVDQYVYSVDPSLADPEFIAWFMRSPAYLETAPINATPGQLPRIRTEEVAATKLFLPPMREQIRVAAALREQLVEVERARAAVAAQLQLAEALPDALLRSAFNNICPLAVGKNGAEPPQGWNWRVLKEYARLESGHTPSRFRPDWWGGEIAWLALPDIRALHGRVVMETKECVNEAGIENSSARVLPKGTVVLSRTASVGFVTLMGRPMATSQDFVNWVCGDEIVPEFLMLLFRAAQDFIVSLGSGAVHKTIYVPTVKEFRVCLPSKVQQQMIVKSLNRQLTDGETLLKKLTEKHLAIEKLSTAFLREAFSGKT